MLENPQPIFNRLFVAALLLGTLVSSIHADDFKALQDLKDPRVVFDRLHPENNVHGEDFSDLNAVGVLAPVNYAEHRVLDFGSASLIDSCHVLTAQHVAYGYLGSYEKAPPLGQTVEVLLGQTEPSDHNLTEGLKYVKFGTVSAYGGTALHEGHSDESQKDWAVVTLTENVKGVRPIELLAMDPADHSKPNWINDAKDSVTSAGYPGDHMADNALVAHAHLWGSYGHVLGVYNDPDSGYAYFTATLAGTPGASGGLAFTKVSGHYVGVGIIQSRDTDGIHDLEHHPTTNVLITPKLLDDIHTAIAANPCPAD